MRINRRNFFAATVGGFAGMVLNKKGWSRMNEFEIQSQANKKSTFPEDLKINRIVGFYMNCQRKKIVGNNAVGGIHGNAAKEKVVLFYTNTGLEGFGRCYAGPHALVSEIPLIIIRQISSVCRAH